jgi:hypothetical protein
MREDDRSDDRPTLGELLGQVVALLAPPYLLARSVRRRLRR